MNIKALIAHRLSNHRIVNPVFTTPAQVVSWLGAVQAQDYAGAKWSVGLRMPGATEQQVEQSIIDRKIVRTWPLRGTLHFVVGDDVRWMLSLIKPHITSQSASLYRQYELDEKTFTRCFKILAEALKGGKQLMRSELAEVLHKKRIPTDTTRLSLILNRTGLEQVICFGARKGNQFTYALLDEWLPETKTLQQDAALRTLATRYFQSRGPASLKDFMWWTGLPKKLAHQGIEMIRPTLEEETVNKIPYWLPAENHGAQTVSSKTFLLPGFDEYMLGYADRSAILDEAYRVQLNQGNAVFSATIVINGRVAGTWKRTIKKDQVMIEAKAFTAFSKAQKDSIITATNRYAVYLGLVPQVIFC